MRATSMHGLLKRSSRSKLPIALFAALTLASVPSQSEAAPTIGTYVRQPHDPFNSGTLKITALGIEQVTIDLTVLANQSRSWDGDTRNGVLEQEVLPVVGKVAIFRPAPDDPAPCVLVLYFANSKQIDISQFGECSWFGFQVNATGVYRLSASRQQKP